MDYAAGFKNGVLLLALVIAIHVILTNPDAIQNLIMYVPDGFASVKNNTEVQPDVHSPSMDVDSIYSSKVPWTVESDVKNFIFSDEPEGALDVFFENNISIPSFTEPSMSESVPSVTGFSSFSSDFSQVCPV